MFAKNTLTKFQSARPPPSKVLILRPYSCQFMGFGKDNKGAIVYESRGQALAALGANAAILIGTKLATTDDFRMLKAEVVASISGLTAGEGEGLAFGLADGDLSVTEVEEALDLNGPLARDDIVITEQAQRPVFLLGSYNPSSSGSTAGEFADKMSGAPFIIGKPRWTFHNNGKGWNWFVYNTGQALTTGSTVKIHAKNFGVWLE